MLCSRTGIGVDRESRRGERPPSHVSTDTSSFAPLNTLTLSGHTEQRPPSLFSPLVLQQNGQKRSKRRRKWQKYWTDIRSWWMSETLGWSFDGYCPVHMSTLTIVISYNKATVTIQSCVKEKQLALLAKLCQSNCLGLKSILKITFLKYTDKQTLHCMNI